MIQKFSDRAERLRAFTAADLYPVVSSEVTLGRDPADVIAAIAAGGAKLVQLREKNRCDRDLCELACRVREITWAHGMVLVIDDRVDIALACGADAVHLGQDDMPLEAARRIAPELVLGSSTHNLEEAEAALAAGADYINVGPVYPTQTKSVACGAVGTEMVRRVTERVKLPFSVMGGIKARHIPELLALGCRRIAMVTEVTQADDITARVRELRALWP